MTLAVIRGSFSQKNGYFSDQEQRDHDDCKLIGSLSGKMIEMSKMADDPRASEDIEFKKRTLKGFAEKLMEMSSISGSLPGLKEEFKALGDRVRTTNEKVLAVTDFSEVGEKLRETALQMEEYKKKYFNNELVLKGIDLETLIPPRDLSKCCQKEPIEEFLTLAECQMETNKFFETSEIKSLENEVEKLQQQLYQKQSQVGEYNKTRREHISKKGKPTFGWMKGLKVLKDQETKIANKMGEKKAELSSLKRQRIALEKSLEDFKWFFFRKSN